VLRIEISKRADGASSMRCTRPDGSFIWQKQVKHAAHFVPHDLTHYAVETRLGYSRGFFGLIAEGWDFDDVTGKGARGPLPPEAGEVEQIVGLFDSERASGTLYTLGEINAYAPRSFTEVEVQAVRKLRSELFQRWLDVSPGHHLELQFQTT
jgi:hypothetical protein